MPAISIILSCYNGEKYLNEAINSFIFQSFSDWEMIFVDDGSSDSSLEIANEFALKDKRIKVFPKVNEGLNSARNYGINFISNESNAIIFSDADDVLHIEMLFHLYTALANDSSAGAAYCNYIIINEEGDPIARHNYNNRYIPTSFWTRALKSDESYTPFVSIYTWTPMIEPLTLLKKDVFLKYNKWDEKHFPKGDTYGESIPLFGEIALNSSVIYVNKALYYYRKHDKQITNNSFNLKRIQLKIDRIFESKLTLNPSYKNPIKNAKIFRKYRLPLYIYLKGDFKYELRYKPFYAIKNTTKSLLKYIFSLIVNERLRII